MSKILEMISMASNGLQTQPEMAPTWSGQPEVALTWSGQTSTWNGPTWNGPNLKWPKLNLKWPNLKWPTWSGQPEMAQPEVRVSPSNGLKGLQWPLWPPMAFNELKMLKMSHLCSPHKWPMEIGHRKWPLKAIVVPNAKHEGYNWSFWRSRVVTKFNWSRVRTTQIPLFSLLTTSKSPHLP